MKLPSDNILILNKIDENQLICSLGIFNPLSPKSDQHQISPCHINAL